MNKITTKTGDDGTTGLLYGSRVNKSDHRIVLTGLIDEVNSVIGMCRPSLKEALARKSFHMDVDHCSLAYSFLDNIKEIQRHLMNFMGEIVAESDKLDRFYKSFPHIKDSDVKIIESRIEELETIDGIVPKDWVFYGEYETSARFDYASKIVRKMEVQLWTDIFHNRIAIRPEVTTYINRLSDYLYLIARFCDKIIKM